MGSIAVPAVNMLDIRRDRTTKSLLEIVDRTLNPSDGTLPSLPTLLLYDDKGLKLFQDITYLDEYYPTNTEIEILTAHAETIANRLPEGIRLVELGSGNLRKIDILLQAFERAQKRVEYYALDLSYSELERTFQDLDTTRYQYVSFNALHGTYDDGLAWLSNSPDDAIRTCILTLGSSLGNFAPAPAARFLTDFRKALKPADFMIVALDACQNAHRVYAAYNDAPGITSQFYRNGLDHVNRLFGTQVFRHDDWSVETKYDAEHHRHVVHYLCLVDSTIAGRTFRKGDRIHLEDAYKFTQEEQDNLWREAGLIMQGSFVNKMDDYGLHLLSPITDGFPMRPENYAVSPVPSLQDWQHLWSAWDTVTRTMIPREELLEKPIKLRNDLIFYLGHIPTFADIHYTRASGSPATEPSYYRSIFERGIDPDVDDPEKCHDHSDIPDSWPPFDEITEYSVRVRARITASIKSEAAFIDRKLGRALWLAFEHEAMHLETFLYMLLQSEHVLPPPGSSTPDFGEMARIAALQRQVNQWHTIPATELTIGTDDAENDLPPDRFFAWDNERPSRVVSIPSFEAQSRPISNGDFAHYLEKTSNTELPASWIATRLLPEKDETAALANTGVSPKFLSDKAIRTVYGPIPLRYALDWPIMASYDELAAYARWAEGRIPTFEEARSIYNFVDAQHNDEAEQVSSGLIDAVNGHLCNDGVEETPPYSHSSSKLHGRSKPDPNEAFIDLSGCNVGFHNWHTTPVTGDGARLRGQGDTGGLWEWTSTTLAPHPGFKSMDLYPGYTSDFFDGKHNICLGGSWATVPRIAGRKSFVNWYQRNYPYTWATARLVRDV